MGVGKTMTQEEIETKTKEYLLLLLKTLRKQYSETPIHVGEQLVSTLRREDGEWLERRLHAVTAEPSQQYPYTPDGGLPCVLSPAQALRIAAVRTWYVNQCFAVEAHYAERVMAGMKFTQLLVAMSENPNILLRWPQREFEWEQQ
jgi:hypothetical protein